jgi:plasmid stabilization system protein ParE
MKMVRVTKTARKDLHDIWHCIAADSTAAATKVGKSVALTAKIANLVGDETERDSGARGRGSCR